MCAWLREGLSIVAVLGVLLATSCGGEVEREEHRNACVDPGSSARGIRVDIKGTRILLRSAAASQTSELIGIALSESTDACSELLEDTTGGPRTFATIVMYSADVKDLPVTIDIRKRAEATFGPDCGHSLAKKRTSRGSVTITEYRPYERIAGDIFAVFDDGEEIQLHFDTCFCNESARCSTPLG